MPDDELERIVVMRSDLDMWIYALGRAYAYSFAHDLAAGYADLRPDAKRSKLTNVLERANNRAEGYLPNVESPSDDPGLYGGESF